MKSHSLPNQNINVFMTLISLWTIAAVFGIVLFDSQISILALALLAMILILTILQIFPGASLVSCIAASVIYAATYFSIYPFTFQLSAVRTPLIIILIFIATAIISGVIIRKINKTTAIMQKDLQILNELIQYDTETGLLIWQHALQKMSIELARCQRYKKKFSLVFIEPAEKPLLNKSDVDRTELSAAIARLIIENCRLDVDLPFSGHHFGVILPETDAEGAVMFAKRLLSRSNRTELLDLRIGTVSFPVDGVTTDELISSCDAALQTAIANEQSIVRSDSIREIEKTNSPEAIPDELPEQKKTPLKRSNKNEFVSLGNNEYLLCFSNFTNIGDLPLVEETITDFAEIKSVDVVNYRDNRLELKLKSQQAIDESFMKNLLEKLQKKWMERQQRRIN